MDLSESIVPRSDQLNADDLMTGPRTVTITEVLRGNTEQPVNVVLAEFGPSRPYKPSKSMRRVMVAAWGKEAAVYTGRRLTIYRDPEITFGKDKVGGIRISHLSHIDKPMSIALTVTRGKRTPYTVQPLVDEPTTEQPISDQQSKRLHALFSAAQLDKAAALDLCAQEVGHPVSKTAELTATEAASVIAALEAVTQEGDHDATA